MTSIAGAAWYQRRCGLVSSYLVLSLLMTVVPVSEVKSSKRWSWSFSFFLMMNHHSTLSASALIRLPLPRGRTLSAEVVGLGSDMRMRTTVMGRCYRIRLRIWMRSIVDGMGRSKEEEERHAEQISRWIPSLSREKNIHNVAAFKGGTIRICASSKSVEDSTVATS